MAIPDWQLPPGVDRGLWDYLNASDMVAGYDEQMRTSPLAAADLAFCEKAFPTPGRLIDLGCGTGRLCLHFASKQFECVGVDLSPEMLSRARENWNEVSTQVGSGGSVHFAKSNLTELIEIPSESFEYAACLFSTLGMICGRDHREKAIANAHRVLKPRGQFVLHVHNRFFRGLGWKRACSQLAKSLLGKGGDIAMQQAYAGAPLSLYHFTKWEAVSLLESQGFTVREVLSVGSDGRAAWPLWHIYGWLILAERRS
jgi:ubiquinone/menaquinone biosynthesis C-methylase UbiE